MPSQLPLKSTKRRVDGQTDGLIFNPMKDLDPKDKYTRTVWNLIKRIWVIFWTPSSHGHTIASLENVQKIRKKYTYWYLAKPGTHITCTLRVLNIPSLKAVTENGPQECQKCRSHMINHYAHDSIPSIMTKMIYIYMYIPNIFEFQLKLFKLSSGKQNSWVTTHVH